MTAKPMRYYKNPAESVEFDCKGCAYELRVFERFVGCERGKSHNGARRCKEYKREA